MTYDAIVLAGGAATRLGGADKPALPVGTRTLLDRVLATCPDARTTVVVGSRRPTARPVHWTRETPPGGGPLAALDAGLRATTAPLVLVLSADLPFLDRATVQALLNTPSADGATLRDPTGHDQPLVAAYRAEPLRREIALLATEHGTLANLPLRALTAELDLTPVSVTATAPLASFDCDTWEDLAAARARIREHGNVLDEWMTAVKNELGIDVAVDTKTLLDLARDAAHGVARPAAPLTTFLVGYAAAQAAATGADPAQAVADASRKAADLALRWAAEAEADAQESGSG
ncbi:NTP transferase domain-containing protein [Streptomyces sp. NBC_01565]|uniref:NTP transferase domain-containing protein n=1 Tax=Streptomyces sp. NBC_01565 TaxID=2975881 RepID=UPI00225373A5|nr:NTP transferase domain-containing protein [Streptomyces sp. NBC_01565]MCX4542534.1 molybdenum cofactor guanylyltransferase [Streptomyces sp. NBC_01565]